MCPVNEHPALFSMTAVMTAASEEERETEMDSASKVNIRSSSCSRTVALYSSLCSPLCDRFPLASVPFVGGNLLLSQLVYIKTVLQATSYEKTSTVPLCFPGAPGQRPSRGVQWLRQPRVTAHHFCGGRLGGVLEPFEGSQL